MIGIELAERLPMLVSLVFCQVARGNCFLEYTAGNGQRTAACVVYGLKKFTGGLGDDDEDGAVPGKSSLGWTKFFTKVLYVHV